MTRVICDARRRNGEPCRRPAGWGTEHAGYGTCKLHGGSTPNAGKAAAKLEAAHQAQRLSHLLGIPAEVDAHCALMNCLAIAAGEVEYCSHRLALLSSEAELALPVPSLTRQHWIYAQHEALDRVVRYAKIAIDAGVADRQVADAERLGGIIGKLLRGVLGDLALSVEQQAVAPTIVQRHLTLMAQTDNGA